MKLIHCADLHIGKSRRLPGYLERQGQMLDGIYDLAANLSDGLVVIAGDIYDRLDLLPREKDLFVRSVSEADAAGITTVIINGNHDMIDDADGGYTHLRVLRNLVASKRLKRTFVIETEPVSFDIPSYKSSFICVPARYRKTKEVNKIVAHHLKAHPPAWPVIAVVHEAVYGARNDAGKRMGVDVGDPDHCVSLDHELPVLYWALGDIHKPQRIKGVPNAWYCGAPIQHDFGDSGDRGVLLVDTDNPTEPELVELPVKKLVTVQIGEDVPTDAYVRVEGSPDDLAVTAMPENVIATKPVLEKSAEYIEVEQDEQDVLSGLDTVLESMGLDRDAVEWCVREARSFASE